MNMGAGPEEQKEARVLFDSWCEIEDRKKELKGETDAILSQASQLMDVKKTKVRKTFVALKKKMEGEEDDNEEINEIIELYYRNKKEDA